MALARQPSCLHVHSDTEAQAQAAGNAPAPGSWWLQEPDAGFQGPTSAPGPLVQPSCVIAPPTGTPVTGARGQPGVPLVGLAGAAAAG